MSLVFTVQGSQPEPYQVEFSRDGDTVRATCTCVAGSFGQVCKHRIELLDEPSTELAVLIENSNVSRAPMTFHAAEFAAVKPKKAAADAKKALGLVMNGG